MGVVLVGGIGGLGLSIWMGAEGTTFFGLSLYPIDVFAGSGLAGGAIGGILGMPINRITYPINEKKEVWKQLKKELDFAVNKKTPR